jgi:outer membrane protein OmpA-like peptidoglycan-associated protein
MWLRLNRQRMMSGTLWLGVLLAACLSPVAAPGQSKFDNDLSESEMIGRLRSLPAPRSDPGAVRSIILGRPSPAPAPAAAPATATAGDAATFGASRPAPALQLRVNFAFDSAQLSDDAKEVLTKLGGALKSRELQADRFLIAGHTDAVGGDGYNQKLSEDRSRAVRAYLAASGVDDRRLSAIGRGRSQLADPAHPRSGINRRVEVVNIGP